MTSLVELKESLGDGAKFVYDEKTKEILGIEELLVHSNVVKEELGRHVTQTADKMYNTVDCCIT